jgi:hypothetical protein
MIPEYRFYITYSTVTREVFPCNFLSTLLVDEKESGRMFFRRKFSGELLFGTNSWAEDDSGTAVNRKDDWQFLWDIEQLVPCEKLYLEITKDGLSHWIGYFSTSDGKFDIDNCTFRVTPIVYDKYSVFDEFGDDEINLLGGVLAFQTTTMSRMLTYGVVTDFEYTRCIYLIDVIEYLVQYIDPLATISSDFLTAATNPITLADNRYNLLTISQKSDIKRWNASDKAWKGYMSFNKLMEILKIMNLYWEYDASTHTFYVEHISSAVFSPAAGLDLRTQKLHTHVNKYEYDKANMPASEIFSFMESENEYFIDHSIKYYSTCSNQDKGSNTVSYSWNVTTDIEYIQDCMASSDKKGNISDDGWVILANYDDGGLKVYMNHTTGYEIRFNADMSWAILHLAFFKHDRPILTGYMNNALDLFYTTRKTRVQECSAIICEDFDPNQEITTELGETYFSGIKASVLKAEHSPMGMVKLRLGYGQPDNPIIPFEYENLIQIEEVANTTYPTVPTATTYYAQTSVPADADITIDFDVRILDDWGAFHDDHGQITILNGATSGSTTVNWTAPAEPLASNLCRFNIYNVVVAGGMMVWEYYFNLDEDADCL